MSEIEHTQFGPCVTEDAQNCYWNAPTMGVPGGTSFIDVQGTDHPITGCAPGEGLPAVDFDAEGLVWAYCEPALGNDDAYVATDPTEQTTVEVHVPVMEQLPATGASDLAAPVTVGAILVAAGIAALITRVSRARGRRRP
jgi:LPXTG-motif cell wall-anchored protein